jgi:hypothetical protein
VSGLFHRLWSKAVGTPTYDKDEWKALEIHLAAEQVSEQLPEARRRVFAEMKARAEAADARVKQLEAGLAELLRICEAIPNAIAADPSPAIDVIRAALKP